MTVEQAEQLRVNDTVHNSALSSYSGELLIIVRRGIFIEYNTPCVRIRGQDEIERYSFVSLTSLVRRAIPLHVQLPEGI